MQKKAEYKTQQKEEIVSWLKEHPGQHVTVAELCAQMEKPVGMATVYRQLDKLVEAGLVMKYVLGPNTPACFSYGEHVRGEEEVFHCRCEKCGTLFHVRCRELAGLARHLEEGHGFHLLPARTVFYGICSDCYKKTAGDAQ